MSEDFKLIGYSSDDLEIDVHMVIYNNNMNSNRFGKPIKNKKQVRQEKREKVFTKEEPKYSEEWFVYLVDGEKWYYKAAQDLNVLRMHHKAEFLGIGRPNQPVTKNMFDPYIPQSKSVVKKTKATINIKKQQRFALDYCCYCECKLTKRYGLTCSDTDKTRDHVIPKSKGGKILKDCCYACNQEKGSLMLHSYIQMLCLLQNDMKPGSKEYLLTQTKIDNANKIAKEIDPK